MRSFFIIMGGIAFGYSLSLVVRCASMAIDEWAQQTMLDAIHTHWVWEQKQLEQQMFAPDCVNLDQGGM